jgi:replicative DNA helicase
LEAERAVLGSLLLDSEQIPSVAEFLTAEDFYKEAHKKIFNWLQEQSRKGEKADALGLTAYVVAASEGDAMGGAAYVSSLPDFVATTENVEYHANIVRENSIRRRLLQVAHQIAENSYEGSFDVADLLDQAEKDVMEVSQSQGHQRWNRLSEVLDIEWQNIEKRSEHRGEVTGIPTGLTELDAKLAGLQKTDLLILAARPGMGKTALALNIAQHAAVQHGTGVGFFSLEMSRGQLATRMLVSEARVKSDNVRRGFLSTEFDWPRLETASETLFHAPLWIDDSPGLSITQVRAKARRLKREHPEVELIVVDYLQLMRGTKAGESREQEISGISRGLKALAKELNVAVLALSQLNRGVESRTDKRPLPSDLRESGAIEQDADVIMFIYRDEQYNPETTEKGIAEIIVAKQRNGETGTARVSWQGQYTRFENLARRDDFPGGYA